MAQSTCSVDGCDKPWRRRQWCHTHYEFWRRKGYTPYVPPTIEERFWQFVDRSGDCWTWTGTRIPPWGYGSFSVDGTKVGAHRYSYELHNGTIPEGLQVDHLCFNPPCVNPAHLEAVTPRVNTVRSKARITHCPQGHPYSGDNLALIAGSRRCKACAYPRVRAWKRRQKEQAA